MESKTENAVLGRFVEGEDGVDAVVPRVASLWHGTVAVCANTTMCQYVTVCTHNYAQVWKSGRWNTKIWCNNDEKVSHETTVDSDSIAVLTQLAPWKVQCTAPSNSSHVLSTLTPFILSIASPADPLSFGFSLSIALLRSVLH
jgi:hypothetical protein